MLPAESSSLSYPDYGIPADYATDAGARPQRDPSFGTTSGVNKDKALLLYRDSFGEAIIPLLSSNLGRAVYSQEFPYNLTLADNSGQDFDLIMIELVERNIPNLLSSAPFVPAVEKQLLKAHAGPVLRLRRSKKRATRSYAAMYPNIPRQSAYM